MSLSSQNPADVARTLYHALPRPGEEFLSNAARWQFVQRIAANLLNGELYTYPGKPKHPDYDLYREVLEIARGHVATLRAVSVRVTDPAPAEDFNPLDAIDELRTAVARKEN